MRLLCHAALGLSFLASCGAPAKKGAASPTPVARVELSPRDIVQRYKAAIVRIENDMGVRVGVGTGFIVTDTGRIATNLHVIAGGGTLKVKLSDGREFAVPRVVAVDTARDLAVIEIDAGAPLPTVPLGDSDAVAPGDAVIVIGNPMSLDFTVSDGLISSLRRIEDVELLQISAPISPGSSGGPLFNNFGEVVGVAMMVSTEGQNLNFGVPAKHLQPLLQHKGFETAAEFAAHFPAHTLAEQGVIKTDKGIEVKREVPEHEMTLLDSCDRDQVIKVFTGINRAIELGAPLYNDGDHEACYNIYRQTANHFEKDEKLCKGLRDAFGDGMLKAETQSDATRKAWAMRDTFDGVLAVIVRKAQSMR